jgi:hypothetical protein
MPASFLRFFGAGRAPLPPEVGAVPVVVSELISQPISA